MRIVIVGQALQKAGYDLLLLAPETFQRWMQDRGVPFIGLHVNIQAVLDLLASSEINIVAHRVE